MDPAGALLEHAVRRHDDVGVADAGWKRRSRDHPDLGRCLDSRRQVIIEKAGKPLGNALMPQCARGDSSSASHCSRLSRPRGRFARSDTARLLSPQHSNNVQGHHKITSESGRWTDRTAKPTAAAAPARTPAPPVAARPRAPTPQGRSPAPAPLPESPPCTTTPATAAANPPAAEAH